MPIRTIFTMSEECAAGQRTGWYEFVRDYEPLTRFLLTHYFPCLVPEIDAHIRGVFERARSENNAWFSSFKFQNEREFMMSFRDLVFAYGRANARLPVPEISLEQMRE